MKKSIKLILLSSVLAVVAAAVILLFIFKDSIFNVPTKESYTFINPDPARAETDAGMKIDGVFDEAVYSQNTWTYLHNANGGNTVDLAITSYFGEKGIYFAYEVRESTPIYVNMDRASWMNSCIEMYLVPSSVKKMPSENIFEIDLLPTGYLLFKRPNAAGGWSDVSTTHDKMAYLGAKPFGGEVNTDECTGYDLELFIPYDYLELLGVDPQLVKEGYVNVNPCHITSYNEDGTDGSVDRFWYSFGKQLGGDGWNDVNRYFKFNASGAMGTVTVDMEQGENCTISGKPNAIPGLNTTVTITPDAGYALTSILCDGEELLPYVNYQEDGSAVVTLPTPNEGFHFTAAAEPIRDGNKALTGTVELKNIFGDTLDGVSASYEDASGQHKLELSSDGSFLLSDIPQGYYIIRVKKDGYLKTERTLCVNRDLNVVVEMPYDLFLTESGNCWNVSTANDGVLTKINGTGSILTKDSFGDFYVETNLCYSEELSKEFKGDDYQQQRMGLRIKFDNGKYWHIDLLRQDDGKYHLQFGKILGQDSLFNWNLVTELTTSQIAWYQSEEGIKLGVLRMGRTAYIYLDNALVGKTDLGAEQASCKAQIGFESFVSNGKVMTVPFALDVTAPARVQLTDDGSVGATASLNGDYHIGETVTVRIHKNAAEADARLLSVQINGKEMAQNTVSVSNGYRLTIPNNLEKVLSVKVIYAKPAKKTVELDVMDTSADGISVRLMQEGSVKANAIMQNGKAVFTDIYQGTYEVQVRIWGVWTDLDRITILDEDQLQTDIKTLFETVDQTNYTGNVTFSGTNSKYYSIATDISGDAWFAMKLQMDKARLDTTAANKGNIRLGYRMFFGGYEGNYEWENEYEITLKYTPEGNWAFEQMNTWQSYEIPAQMVEALTGDGLHMALQRDPKTGVVTLHYGATEAELLSGQYACKWENEKHKENIRRFGVGFWSENGSNYKASVSNLRYGTSLSQLFGIKETMISLQLTGHKDGTYSVLPENTQVLVSNAMGQHWLSVDESGKIDCKLLPGRYTVSVDGYTEASIEVSQSGIEGQLALEYDLFHSPTGWDTEKHDLSKVNDSTPGISMSGGTMNVLTNDSFSDVSASLWAKASNSTHSAHTQGIWIRFEDGKYMILYQEDAKLAYMQNLWDFETVQNAYAVVCESLPNDVLNKWSSDGYELRLIRKENRLFVMVESQLYHTQNLPDAYADDQVQIGFFSYDCAADANWNFEIQSDFPAYSILCNEAQNGVVTADKTSAGLGETVTLTITPETGYLLKSLTVNGQERVQDVTDSTLSVLVLGDVTVEAAFESAYVNGLITSNIPVEDGTAIRLLQDGTVLAEGTFTDAKADLGNIIGGRYDAEIQVFGYWAKLTSLNILSNEAVEADVAALFENPEFADYDGNVTFMGKAAKHCSVATNISSDAWFTMKVQVDKAQLNAVAANKGNIRLGYRLFFGGESGNYLWENEFEPTLKYTAEGRWVIEQMNSWEGWDYYLSDEMVNALTSDGLYLALHRDSESGVLTMYYGATQAELLTQSNSFTYAQKATKHKETITRFGAGFWSENGSDYQALVSNLRYSTSLQDSMETFAVTLNTENVPDSTAIRFTQNGKECVSGVVQNGHVMFDAVATGSYHVEVKIYGAWSPVTSVNVSEDMTADIDVLSVFENREFTNFDGNISFTGTTGKNYSVATDISGDAWFAMKIQVDKAKLDAVAANKGNIRLGFRMFFGGEPGNSGLENEYELTLKYNAEGRWIVEQMQSWEGWNYYLSQDAIDALTGDGLYIAMHRNVQTGVLTLYYGDSKNEMLSNSFTYSQAASKHKENITRFGVAFWSENGSDYTVAISDLCYGATMEDATQQMQ